jgi:anaerobic magnesium-protoporphyrin IX monomethyl ester cyclase
MYWRKNMKIALILPEWNIENSYPPLGLAYIGAVLERERHVVKIFDLTLGKDRSIENKMEDVIRFAPDIIGISVMTHSYSSAIKTALYLKNTTGAYIVFGGPHPTIMPEDVLKNAFIDFVIIGEGEDTFLKICQNLQTKKFSGIGGLCYKENGKLVIQPKDNFIENLDSIPFPARHLLKIDDYKLVDDRGHPMVTIMSSRGCPYGCIYCYKGLFGRTYRQRSPEDIVGEIKSCIKLGYKSFYFIDDLFTLNAERVDSLTKAIKEEKLDIRWQCLARVNNATLEMFKKMKDAGCYKVHFGIESGNQNILNRVKKGITLAQVRNAVKCCKEADIKTKGYFMIGMPGDTEETIQDTLRFAKELELNDTMFSITTPFPGTELWDKIDKSKIGPLSDACYFIDNSDKDSDFHIFYNLSDVKNEDIIRTMKEAQKISENIRMMTSCRESFGRELGYFAWQISRISILGKCGKTIMRLKRSLIETG